MKALEIVKNEIENQKQLVRTENNDLAYKSTLNANLDFFGIGGALRYSPDLILPIFKKAIDENYHLAIQNLLYLRDPRAGMGERNLFRICFKHICRNYPEDARRLFSSVVDFGRYDDLFVAKDTGAEKFMLMYIKKRLETDLKSNENSESVSLLAKWMPSINASSYQTKRLALYFCEKLGYSKKDYRKILSTLRKGRIIENDLRIKNYTFDYGKVPSKAFHKYREAFIRNDNERYMGFINSAIEGKAKINTSTLYPYEIVRGLHREMTDDQKRAEQAKWASLPRSSDNFNTIVVRDGSGSMTWNDYFPISVASSLAILFSEQLKGEFKNKFITFSSEPELVEIDEKDDIFKKVVEVTKYNDCSNTDISKVYDLIYDTSIKIKKTEDYIQRIVIISDMEFDSGTQNVPTYEIMKEKFERADIPLPEVVFWNVAARRVHFAAKKDQPNIRLVSGASQNVIKAIINNKSTDAVDFMLQTLSKYAERTEGLQKM